MDTREVHENAPDRQDVLAVPRSHDEARKYYNRISPIYDFLAERSERRARVLGLELLEIKESEKILEVGFGHRPQSCHPCPGRWAARKSFRYRY